jgi:hypothetical protein
MQLAPNAGPGAPALLDHLACTGEQRRRNVEAERLGSLEVDDQFDFRGLLLCSFLLVLSPFAYIV